MFAWPWSLPNWLSTRAASGGPAPQSRRCGVSAVLSSVLPSLSQAALLPWPRHDQMTCQVWGLSLASFLLFQSLSGSSASSARPQSFSLSTRASLSLVSVCSQNLMTMWCQPNSKIANYLIEVKSNAEQKHLPRLSNYWIKRFKPAVWRRRWWRKWLNTKNQYLLKLLGGGVGRSLRRRMIAISINVRV